jgi:hypothetical protein
MSSWADFEGEAPALASAGRELFDQHVLAYLATIRADGSPRLHPVVPVLTATDLFVAIGSWSPKWRDLHRDTRCVLHALPGARDDELMLRCLAVEEPGALETVRAAAPHVVHDDDHLFRFDLQQADHGWWELVGRPGTYPTRRRWTPGGGVTEVVTGRG